VERRWILVPLSLLIGLASLLLLWVTLVRDFFDYVLYPIEKAADAYIYPQLRYTAFDIVLILWCIDGLVISALFLQSVIHSRSVSKTGFQALTLYCVLFVVLFLGGLLMLFARSYGY